MFWNSYLALFQNGGFFLRFIFIAFLFKTENLTCYLNQRLILIMSFYQHHFFDSFIWFPSSILKLNWLIYLASLYQIVEQVGSIYVFKNLMFFAANNFCFAFYYLFIISLLSFNWKIHTLLRLWSFFQIMKLSWNSINFKNMRYRVLLTMNYFLNQFFLLFFFLFQSIIQMSLG